MAQHQAHSHDSHDEHESHGSLKEYIIGFILSLILTAIPLIFVLNDIVEGTAANVVLLVTAVLQFVVQLFFFMHLKEEKKPRWNFMALILGIAVVIIIVLGSIWIMGNNEVVK